MHRYGFIADNIRHELRRTDFHTDPILRDATALEQCVETAISCIGKTQEIEKHIVYELSGRKRVARATSSAARLAFRLVNRNIRDAYEVKVDDRESIVKAMCVLLAESVKYRIYKLDVRSFYESFEKAYIISSIRKNVRLTEPAKRVIEETINNHAALGNTGLPRGLVISASLSDALMQEFDENVRDCEDVFFYRRYVDDITIITSAREDSIRFSSKLSKFLPPAMQFKKNKHDCDTLKALRQKTKDPTGPIKYTTFDYLGYRFNVANNEHFPSISSSRHVWLDIADKKVKRIKTRLVKAYIDYIKSGDFALLEMRVRHLTSNISLIDRGKGITRLSGIHYSYPLVDIGRSSSLKSLDRFLINSLASTSAIIFKQLNAKLNASQRAGLLRYSFYSGAKMKRFYQLSVKDLAKVQRCWKHG